MEKSKQIEGNRWAAVCHLAAWIGWIGIPLGNILGPLVVWLLLKNTYPSADHHGKEALNFQISWTLYVIGLVGLLVLSLGMILWTSITPMFMIFFFLPIAITLAIANFILVIIASVKANKGILYHYPLTIRFIK